MNSKCNLLATNDPFYYYTCYDELIEYNAYNTNIRHYLNITSMSLMGFNVLVFFISWMFVTHDAAQLKYLKVLAFTTLILFVLNMRFFPVNEMLVIVVVFGVSIVVDIYYNRLQYSTVLLMGLLVANALMRIIAGIDNVFSILEISYDSLINRIKKYRTDEEYVEVKLGEADPKLFLRTRIDPANRVRAAGTSLQFVI